MGLALSESVFVKRHGKQSLSVLRLRQRFGKRGGLRVGSERTSGARLGRYSLLAEAAAKDVLRVFPARDRGQLERLRLLLAVLTDLPTGVQDIDVGKDSAGRYYSELVATQLARSVAIGIHVRLHLAFAKGIEAGASRSRSSVRRGVRSHEQALRGHLVKLRDASIAGDAAGALAVLDSISKAAHNQLADVIREAAQVSLRPGRRDLSVGLEASILARRHAMTAAGSVFLHRRLMLDRLVRPTKRAVERTNALRRTVVRPELARTQLSALDGGGRFSFLGRTSEVEWIERPRKPFTRVEFEGATLGLHVPQRSLERRGVRPGTVLWAMGTVKAGEPPYLESEFEGPGQHKAEYFEDYLATLARPAYDLYPGTMLLEWEFPPLERGAGANDLVGRML